MEISMDNIEGKICINCFGRLEIYVDGKEQSMEMKSAKARELIAFLMTYKGAAVSKATVCEALWGETPIEYSKDCLYKLVRRIKDMSMPFHIECSRGMMRLNIDNIESDILQFEALAEEKENVKKMEQLIDVYKGSLLEEECYGWINMKAAAYDKKYMDTICSLEEYYQENNRSAKQNFYRKLMVEYS